MRRTMLWMLTLLIGLTPLVVLTEPAESQTRKSQTKKPTAASNPAPIATAEHEAGGVEVALLEVKRTSSDSVTIKFRYTNKTTDTKKLDHGGQWLDAWRFAWDAYFVDPATNKKYVTLKDQDGNPVAANHQQFGTGITLAARQVVNTWAKFPAPRPAWGWSRFTCPARRLLKTWPWRSEPERLGA
jgi:hypothetical protein